MAIVKQGTENTEDESDEQDITEMQVIGLDNGSVSVFQKHPKNNSYHTTGLEIWKQDLMLTLHFFFWIGNIPLLMSNLIHPKCFWRMKQNEDKHGEVVTGCVFYLIAEQSSEVKVDLKENFRFALDVLYRQESHGYQCVQVHQAAMRTANDSSTKLTYGPFNPILSDHGQFSNLYQMAPKDTALVLAMVSLMLHFNWNWVGLAISDDDQGLQFLSDLRRESEVQRVCLAFVIVIPVNMELYMSRAEVYNKQIETSSTNVVIIYGDTDSTLAVCFRIWVSQGIQRIWVTTSQWDVTTSKGDFTVDSFQWTLAFAHHHAEISGFKNFVQTLNLSKYTDISLAGLEWMYFSCEASTSNCKTLENCSLNVSLEWLTLQSFDMAFSDDAYDIYNAVYAMAHALHEMLLQQGENQPMNTVRSLDSDCSQLCFVSS
ncbi:vomeronasal type-2 receptor 116-like [Peromyscus eremicus]|uniref:vomeronasal type-2 receptor 116-like n=1 Tax=Peromyscus eremicus TaxID=42410 RepID=UPI0027DCABCB|nr:vomeronasal type-2 receptor 116-like [Peromyscus eremicus]